MKEQPIIYLKDINGDKIEDLLIEYLRPGRGGNNVSMLYLFDQKSSSFEKISNSYYFPNLDYDNKLNMMTSFRFYGGDGVQMDFLKVEKDSLSSKFRVIREGKAIYVKKWNGKKFQLIEEKTISNDIIIPEIEQLEPIILIKDY